MMRRCNKLSTAWTEEVQHAGQFRQVLEPLTVLPRPVQQPPPPIYVACFSRPTKSEWRRGNEFNAILPPCDHDVWRPQEAVAQFQALAREAGYPRSKVMCRTFSASPTPAEALCAKERLLATTARHSAGFPG